MARDTSIAGYFERIVPEQFAAAVADAPQDVRDQPELRATYNITGEGGGIYGLRIKEGQLEVVRGGIPDSDMYTTVAVDDWQRWIAEAASEPVVDYVRRGKVGLLKNLKGVLKLDLTRDDGPNYQSTVMFGNADTPEVTLFMDASDYMAMISGKLNGQLAFMMGKLKFEGSLPLLMQLAALNSA